MFAGNLIVVAMKMKYFLLSVLFFQVFAIAQIPAGPAGLVDESFTGLTGYPFYNNCMDNQSDGKLVYGRGYLGASGNTTHVLRRLNLDGSIDNSFIQVYAICDQALSNYNQTGIIDVHVLPDDRILMAGNFGAHNPGYPPPGAGNLGLTRLLPNGRIDSTFNFDTGNMLAEVITCIFINNAGEIIVGGYDFFEKVEDNGDIDFSFGNGFQYIGNTILTIDQFSNGKYLLGGNLPYSYPTNLVRCLSNGNPDPTWNIGTGFNDQVTKVIIQPDQKILVLGGFTQFNGTPVKRICRLNEDGTLDPTFNVGTGALATTASSGIVAGSLNDMIILADGKLLVVGLFDSFNGHANYSSVRLNLDGSVDTGYGDGVGLTQMAFSTYALASSVLQLPDTKIMVMGKGLYGFKYASGATHESDIVRLFSCSATSQTQTISACDSLTWVDGNTYHSNNNSATFTFISHGGCDSTIALNLIIDTPVSADALSSLSACDNYMLPSLTSGNYYTQPNGGGMMLNAGDVISGSQTLYVYASNGTCSDENSFEISIDAPVTAAAPGNETSCESYTLPLLATGDYFTESNAGGTMLNAGDVISGSQTLYVYASNGTCSDENSFEISIDAPVTADAPGNETSCESYTLPSLATGDYFTESNAGGTMLNAGDVISGSQTLYVYASNGTCSDENSFEISIDAPVAADAPSNESSCESYTLPSLATGDYFTESNAGGTMLNAGDVISSSQTLYVYAENGTCSDENSFGITINELPVNTVSVLDNILTADQAGAMYQWLDCNNGNAEIPGAIAQSYAPTANGSYAVAVTLSGCTETSACATISTIGINDNTFSEGINLYPNPATSVLYLSIENMVAEHVTTEMLDIRGRGVSTSHPIHLEGTHVISYNVEALPAGVYIVRLHANGNSTEIRFVKQ
jgi:uncharacterized delta-60 repeat protein